MRKKIRLREELIVAWRAERSRRGYPRELIEFQIASRTAELIALRQTIAPRAQAE